jgi:ectoine hydroxylase-related dioxygenase (phytanoyl-CoA dioxygenase family)
MRNTPVAVDVFREQGYYLAQGILPRELVQRVHGELNALVTRQLRRLNRQPAEGTDDEAVYANLKALFDADLHAYLASLTLSAKLFSVHAMIMHENVAKAMQELGIECPVFQSAPVLHIMSNGLRIPGGYAGVGVHQDWPSLQGSLDTITIWIPLVDVPEDLFPLEIIPGSHRYGLCHGTQKEHSYEVDASYYDEKDFIRVKAERGDALLFSAFTIHRTGQRGTEGVRLSVSARYENAAEPTFVDRLYPFAQKRSVQREFIVKDFPSREQVAKLYEPLPHSK